MDKDVQDLFTKNEWLWLEERSYTKEDVTKNPGKFRKMLDIENTLLKRAETKSARQGASAAGPAKPVESAKQKSRRAKKESIPTPPKEVEISLDPEVSFDEKQSERIWDFVEESDGYIRAKKQHQYADWAVLVDQARLLPKHFEDVIRLRADDFLVGIGNVGSRNLIITGPVGTGKTVLACDLVMRAIEQGKTAIYLKQSELEMFSRLTVRFGQEALDEKNIKKNLDTILKTYDLVVLDELDNFEKSDRKSLDQLFDTRYASNKQTVVISNYIMYNEETGFQDRLSKALSRRTYSRLKSFEHIYIGGKDKRENDMGDKGFVFPVKVLANNKHAHLPNFIPRNPIFVPMTPKERSMLEYEDALGNTIDISREKDSIFYGAWEKADIVILRGAVCCTFDAMIYLGLMKILTDRHNEGLSGLSIRTNANEVYEALGYNKEKIGGIDRSKFKRSIQRLSSMTIDYRNKDKGTEFSGSLITMRDSLSNCSASFLDIDFNKGLIALYAKKHFEILEESSAIFDAKNFDFFMSLFLATHRAEDGTKTRAAKMGAEKLLNLIGKQDLPDEKKEGYIKALNRYLKVSKHSYSKKSKVHAYTL